MWTVLDRHTENDLPSLQDTPVGDITCTSPIFSGDTSNARWGFQVPKKIRNGRDKKKGEFLVCVVSVLSGHCASSLLVAGAGCRVFPTPFLLGDSPLRVLVGRAKEFRKQAWNKDGTSCRLFGISMSFSSLLRVTTIWGPFSRRILEFLKDSRTYPQQLLELASSKRDRTLQKSNAFL